MLDYLYPVLTVIISIASLIILIVVLIKSFKEGAFKGILGILTCGFFTFIWGWIKHKELQITKLMLLWTVLIILSFVIPMMVGTAQVMKIMPMLQEQALNLKGQKKTKLVTPKKKTRVAKKKRSATAKNKKGGQARKKKGDWNSRAVALWKNGKYTNPNQAIEYLNKAIEKNPKFAEAYNNRGNAYRDLNQLQKAFADYNQAISLKPDYVQAYNNRGNIYYDLKKYQLALNDYNKSLSLNPSYRLAYLNRGLAYSRLKKANLACNDLQKACKMGDCDGLNWAKKTKICKN
ncbi:MAG: tetratricopeptide repeat protein [Deltaproteobacteria bacterium]|nr:MAG: tetratricopeptide repeat protein [Deltaproteobacteria bacterium]